MSEVLFFEKPGCVGNSRQKALLASLGHRLDVRSILSEPWTAERLRPFFCSRPVADWFNPTAPRVRDGEVDPETLDESQALALMTADPLLIRRPLIEVDVEGAEVPLRGCGFAPGPLLDALGVKLGADEDLQSCAKGGDAPACPDPSEDAAPAGVTVGPTR